jgi:outer membrane lipoprotein-sorting protein
MRLALLCPLGVAVLLGAQAVPAGAQTAREIMEKVDARDDGDNSTATLEMILIDKRGDKRVRQVTTFTRDEGRDMQRIMFFLAPADVRGTGFLTYDYYSGEKDDDQWLYLPELRKTKRIASSDKSGSFMGTDFSYADMTRRVLDEWTYKILKEDEVRGNKVWLIEALPRDKTVRDRYGYDKSVVFIRQDIFMAVRAVHWVRDGAKLKYLDMKQIEQIDGIWMGTELDMKITKGGETLHRTVMRFSDVKFNQAIDEGLFTVRRLEKGP